MTTRSNDEDVILSRTFESEAGPVLLRFLRPTPYPKPGVDADPNDPPWRCGFTIRFPDEELRRSYSVGVDSIQSLLLAFASARHLLHYVGNGTPARRPPVRWLGEDDLGLTINHIE